MASSVRFLQFPPLTHCPLEAAHVNRKSTTANATASPAALLSRQLSSAALCSLKGSNQLTDAAPIRAKKPCRSTRVAPITCQAQRGVRTKAVAAPANVKSASRLRVSVSNRVHKEWTAIEIETQNQPGLLTKITSTLR
jgi:7-keto-8-aminopelargonate synthetase-like enzyme